MWGPGAQGGFQNALATGLQLGGMVRQQTDARNERNALAAFVRDPNKETAAAVAPYQPKLVLDYNASEGERAAAAAEAQVKRDAAAGKPEAMAQLAGIDLNAWRGLTADQRAAAKDAVDAMGQGALFVANQPPEARAATWDQTIDALSQRFPNLAQYKGAYSEQALQGAIAQAGQFNQFYQMTKPETFNVGPGEGRYERDQRTGAISTIIEPNLQGAPAFSPAAPSGGRAAPVAKQVGQATYYQNPETGQWFDNAEEAMGGGGSNVTGNFPGP
jgi:hypothetical protein